MSAELNLHAQTGHLQLSAKKSLVLRRERALNLGFPRKNSNRANEPHRLAFYQEICLHLAEITIVWRLPAVWRDVQGIRGTIEYVVGPLAFSTLSDVDTSHASYASLHWKMDMMIYYLRRFSESRTSSGSTPSVRPSVRPSVGNTFGVPSLCNL